MTLSLNIVNAKIIHASYAKKVIDKNVDHMNLRKISLYGSVKERFIQ